MAGKPIRGGSPSWTWLAAALLFVGLGWAAAFGQESDWLAPPPRAARGYDVVPEAPLLSPQPDPDGPMPPGVVSGEMVMEVQIAGRKNLPLEKIVPYIRTRAGRPLDMELIEEDVRRMNRSRLFTSVKPMTRQVSGGRIVIFEIEERPVLQYVKYVGNEKVRKKVLAEKAEIKPGDALDPFAVEEGRRKIEDYYRSHGFSNARVTVIEGSDVHDRGAIYLINEGHKQRIWKTHFLGNTIATDARLRTQIQSKPGFLWIFKGQVDRKEIDEDLNRLKAYYASLGFFNAKIGRELEFNEAKSWLTLTFVIEEGPRYKVREVRFLGQERFTAEELAEETKLKAGQYFNQAQLNSDVAAMQDKYGALGYVFADVKPDIRYLPQPGQADLVYEVREGDRYRVGRIDVQIGGEDVTPHTKITTVLNRLSLAPGDVVDIRELRASERRLRASGLFLIEPQRGIQPKIVFSPPDLSDEDVELARDPQRGPQGRGQSPDPGQPSGGWQPRQAASPRDRMVVLCVQGELSDEGAAALRGDCPSFRAAKTGLSPCMVLPDRIQQTQWRPPTEDRAESRTMLPLPFAPRLPPPVPTTVLARGQSPSIGPEGGRTVPTLPGETALPGTGYFPSAVPYQPAAPGAAGEALAGSADGGALVPQGPIYSPGAGLQAQPAPPVAQQPRTIDRLFPGGGILGGGGLFSGLSPAEDQFHEPLRPLPLQAIAEESRTGRIMLGVGVTSDAGLVGSVVIDEQNFDIFRFPHSWEEIRNGTAWRGAGQRLRIEAVPGTQVQRYMVSLTEPYFLDTSVSTGVSGYFYNRLYRDWSEERLGGTVRLGYQFRPDLTGNFTFRGERVVVYDPRVSPALVPELQEAMGDNELFGFRVGLAHDTRDSAFLPTEGHLVEVGFEQVVGSFQYPRGDIDVRKYFLLHQRADGSGRHVLSVGASFAITGEDTPIYDHYFAGGFSSLRGFDFRGASPRTAGVAVGGHMQLLASVQYLFPITADDMLRGVVFCDAGTVERDYDIHSEDFRAAVGFGLRVMIPAMGPAPLAFDFAWPVAKADGDVTEVFSFFIGLGR